MISGHYCIILVWSSKLTQNVQFYNIQILLQSNPNRSPNSKYISMLHKAVIFGRSTILDSPFFILREAYQY